MKGIAIWILGFISFLAGANVVNATIMWFNLGPTSTFRPYLISDLTGAIPIYLYLWVSAIVTLVFLGATSHKAVSELSFADEFRIVNEKANSLQAGQESQQKLLEGMQARVALVDENMEYTRRELSKGLNDQGIMIKQSIEAYQQDQHKTLDGVRGRVLLVEQGLKDVRKGLGDQAEAIKSTKANLMEKVGPQSSVIKEALEQLESRDKKTVAAVAKQIEEIEAIKLRLERLEDALVIPKPLVTSQSSVEDVKGIGHSKGSGLKEIGIVSVGDLIIADPRVVAEKLESSDKTVEKLQGRAQLSMIPGLEKVDLSLLEELDITDRKSLAAQDPIELSKKINAISKANHTKGKVAEADIPTIEEVDTWVKFVRP